MNMCAFAQGDDTMTGDGGEYLRAEDLKELGDDSLPSSQFLDGMNYLRYSLEGGRSDRYYFMGECIFFSNLDSSGESSSTGINIKALSSLQKLGTHN